ncbi:MAG: formate dehydrogenase accessory sulfurtransferase FdhD [Deltaproteobacteria bacterium]|nr:formate dehydrogenase accessory sulfurtransferase FdhD [Deltaproteobacteria bacterium]
MGAAAWRVCRYRERTNTGRHNAAERIGGRAFPEGLDVGDAALPTTGRISSEILVEVARMGVPVLGSRSAPTAPALRLAEEPGVTAVGCMRSGRFNVYTYPGRVQGALPVETGAGHG